MKRLFAIAGIAACLLCLPGCGKRNNPQRFIISGTYFVDGTVVTDDGHEWGYDPELGVLHGMDDYSRVFVSMSDNGTPGKREDDIILGIALRGEINGWF